MGAIAAITALTAAFAAIAAIAACATNYAIPALATIAANFANTAQATFTTGLASTAIATITAKSIAAIECRSCFTGTSIWPWHAGIAPDRPLQAGLARHLAGCTRRASHTTPEGALVDNGQTSCAGLEHRLTATPASATGAAHAAVAALSPFAAKATHAACAACAACASHTARATQSTGTARATGGASSIDRSITSVAACPTVATVTTVGRAALAACATFAAITAHAAVAALAAIATGTRHTAFATGTAGDGMGVGESGFTTAGMLVSRTPGAAHPARLACLAIGTDGTCIAVGSRSASGACTTGLACQVAGFTGDARVTVCTRSTANSVPARLSVSSDLSVGVLASFPNSAC